MRECEMAGKNPSSIRFHITVTLQMAKTAFQPSGQLNSFPKTEYQTSGWIKYSWGMLDGYIGKKWVLLVMIYFRF
jgi:hypothetical protein